LGILLPVLIGLTGTLTKTKYAEIIATAAYFPIAKIKSALKKKEMAEAGADTAVTWANTAAKVANWIASGPAGWAIAAASIALIVGMTAVLLANTKQTEKNTEAKIKDNEAAMDNAKATGELTSKWAEQQDSKDGLIKKYKDLKEAGDDYTETVEEIVAAVPDLIDAYQAAADAVGIDVGEDSAFAKLR
jgi:hypothetical protein